MADLLAAEHCKCRPLKLQAVLLQQVLPSTFGNWKLISVAVCMLSAYACAAVPWVPEYWWQSMHANSLQQSLAAILNKAASANVPIFSSFGDTL